MADNEADLGSAETTPMAESEQQQPQKQQEEEEEIPEQKQGGGEHPEQKQEEEDRERERPTPQHESVKNPEKSAGAHISFSIWPPSQRTRDAVINRLIETLSSPSLLSKRYGSIPRDEAVAIAGRIEQESFSAASETGDAAPGGDGMEILQAYSKEVSKRMLDAVKTRSSADSTGSTVPDRDAAKDPAAVAPPAASEEAPSVEDV